MSSILIRNFEFQLIFWGVFELGFWVAPACGKHAYGPDPNLFETWQAIK